MKQFFCNTFVNRIPSHFIRQFFYRLFGMKIGKKTAIFRFVEVIHLPGIKIGDHCVIGWRCTLDGRGGLTIGDNVNISSDVIIHTAAHDPDSPDFAGYTKPVAIGSRVWISTRAIVLPDVTIGEGAVVAAGAVITKDVGPFEIVAGVPARKVRERNHDLRYQLGDYRCWLW